MIDMILAFIVGTVLGYSIKFKKRPPADFTLISKIEEMEKTIAYYKEITTSIFQENMEMRRKLGGWNNPDLRTYDGKLK
jgi:hypothetical protein